MRCKEQRKNQDHHVLDLQALSHHPDRQVPNHQGYQIKRERAIEEKVRLADLQAEATFMQKKRYAELQAESLQIEEEMAKAQARVKI